MLSTFKLFKLFFKENFRFRSKGAKPLSKAKIILIIIGVGAILLIYGAMFVMLFWSATINGMKDGYTVNETVFYPIFLINFIALAFMLISGNYLSFSDRDLAILGPLPIDEQKIVKAKLLVALLYESSAQIYISLCGIVGLIITGVGTLTAFFAILLNGLLSSVIPLSVLSFIILLIRKAIQKSKHRKSFEMLFSVISFVLIFGLSYYFGAQSGSQSANVLIGIAPKIFGYYPFLFFVKKALLENNALWLIPYVIVTVLFFYLFVLIFNKFAYRLMVNYKYSREEKRKGPLEYRKRNITLTLVKRDVMRLFQVPSLFLNIVISPLIAIAYSLIMIFSRSLNEAIGSITNIPIREIICLGLSAFMTMMVIYPAISLSLDWKYLWILKSLPIETKDIFKAKIVSNLIIQIPSNIIILLIYSIVYKFNASSIIVIFAFDLSLSLFSSIYYLYLGLKHPKTEVEDVYIIKQSAASGFAVLFNFVMILVFSAIAVIFYILTKSMIGGILVVTLLSLVFTIITALILRKKGAALFLNFS